MKKVFLIGVALICTKVYAQIPVTDVAANASIEGLNMNMQIQDMKKTYLSKLQHSETLQKWASNIKLVTDALKTAKQTKKEIENIYQLQDELKKALENIEHIKGISLNDFNFFSKLLLDIDLNPTSYIPRVPQTKAYISDINKAVGGTQSARSLYQTYNGINRYSYRMGGIYYKYAEKYAANASVENQAIKLSLEESRGQLLMEQVIMLNRKIEKNIIDATAFTKMANDTNIKISEAERVDLNERANRLMEEAISMRLNVNELLQDVNTFENRPITKSIFETSIRTKMNRSLSRAAYKRMN